MKKKVISVLLAVIMLLSSVQAIFVFADGSTTEEKPANLIKEAKWTDEDKTKAEIQLTSTFDKKITNGKILFLGGLCNAHTLEDDTVVDALESCAKYGTVTYKLFSVSEGQKTTSGTPIEGTLEKGKSLTTTLKNTINNKLASQRHVIQYDIANVINSTDLSKFDAVVLEFDGFKMGRQDSAPTSAQRSSLASAGKKLLTLYEEGKILWIIPPKSYKTTYDGTSTYIFGDYYLSNKDISGSSKINDNYRKAAFDCLALMAPEDYLTEKGEPKDYPTFGSKIFDSLPTLKARANASDKNKIYVTYDHSENVSAFLSKRFSSHGYQTIDVYDRVNDGFIITKVSGQYYDGTSKTYKAMPTDAFSYKIDKDDPQVVTATFNVTKLDLAQVRLVIDVKIDEKNDPFEKSTKVDTNDGKATAKYMDEDDEGKPVVVHQEDAPTPNLEKTEHKITTSVTNGTISPSKYILEGKNYKVEYAPKSATGYALDSVKVDGKDVSLKDYPSSYTFSDVKAAHSIEVTYLPTYAVTFETNGGTTVSPQTVKDGDKATKPKTNPTKTGYTFDDWYSDEQLTQKYDFDTPIKKPTTIYAKYTENTANITYYKNDGTADIFEQSKLKYTEKTVVTKNTPKRDHYVFLGWDESPSAKTPTYAKGSTAVLKAANVDPKNITLYGIWDKEEYTVDFVTEHGTKPDDQKIKYEGKVTKPSVSAEGYTFNGWYTDSKHTVKYDFNTPVDKSFTLYGDWTENETKITYYSTKDDKTPYKENVIKYTEKETIPANPKRDHYVFLGWDKNPDAKTPTYTSSNPTVKPANTNMDNTVLYGIWEKVKYTINFNTDEGKPAPDDQSVIYGNKATEPEKVPEKEGFIFGGWFTDKDCTVPYDFKAEVTGNITLYAKWIPVEPTSPVTGQNGYLTFLSVLVCILCVSALGFVLAKKRKAVR